MQPGGSLRAAAPRSAENEEESVPARVRAGARGKKETKKYIIYCEDTMFFRLLKDGEQIKGICSSTINNLYFDIYLINNSSYYYSCLQLIFLLFCLVAYV